MSSGIDTGEAHSLQLWDVLRARLLARLVACHNVRDVSIKRMRDSLVYGACFQN